MALPEGEKPEQSNPQESTDQYVAEFIAEYGAAEFNSTEYLAVFDYYRRRNTDDHLRWAIKKAAKAEQNKGLAGRIRSQDHLFRASLQKMLLDIEIERKQMEKKGYLTTYRNIEFDLSQISDAYMDKHPELKWKEARRRARALADWTLGTTIVKLRKKAE